MVSRPRSIRSLNRLVQKPPASNELRTVLLKTLSESNDQTAVIISSSLLEGALQDAILRKFRDLDDNERKEIFETDSVLSTFSAKIKIAYALNICGPSTRDDLDCIRAIRNAFAHGRMHLSFDNPEVSNVCVRIKLPENLGLPDNVTLNENAAVKSRYLITVNSLTLTLDDLNSRGRSPFAGQLAF